MIRTTVVFAAALGFAVHAFGGFAEDFRTPPPGYGEVPFWWWTGEKLDKARLRWQLEELHRAGVAGTQVNYSHERQFGWRTAAHEPKLFTDKWWEMFSCAAEVSAELGMGIGLSGYTLDWPGNDNLFKELGIDSPETEAQILHYENGEVKPVRHDHTLDPLNPESARRVIDRFFRPFWEKVPENARGALNYFFQDELRLAGDRHVWSDDFADEFRKRKGYDVVPKLAALFTNIGPETAKVRLDYNDVMVELTGERYFKPIYDWHASRGLIYACDPATRGYDPLEFGDYMRAMRWYTAPGFDTPGGQPDPVKCKMGSSISHLYGRPRVWLEGYHSLGWQASTETIFAATARNYVYGANLLNLHGLYYSTYGGWWEWAPPCYHFHQPYWALLPHTLKYFERLSWALTRGKHVCDVAILVPQEPCVVDFERAKASVELSHRLVYKLAVEGTTDCDFIDAGSIGTTNEDYRVLILPKMFAMRDETAKRIAAFEKKGGRVIRAETLDDVKLPLVEAPDVTGNKGLKYHHRRTETEDIYYLVDWDGKTDVKFRTAGELAVYDLWTGEKTERPIPGQPVLVVIDRSGLKDGDNRMGAVLKGFAETRQEIAELLADRWTAELQPTLDNRWGDYRRPASPETIAAEVRFMRDENGREVALGYGPQWLDGTNTVEYSRRYGVFGKPVFQNCHHGLNKRPGTCFFILGDYDAGLTDVKASLDAPDVEKTFTTYVYADRETKAVAHYGAEAPFLETWVSYRQREKVAPPELVSLSVDGRFVKSGGEIVLKPGYTPVVAKVRGLGRAIVYFQKNLRMRAPSAELCSRLAYPDVLPVDPFGGARKRGTFTANVSPLAVDAEVAVNGTLLKKEIKDGVLTVEVEYAPGYVGGNCFKDPVRVKTRVAGMKPGDWARYEDLRCYSGGMVYRTRFEWDGRRAAGDAGKGSRYLLSLGQVGCAAEVRLNGGKPRAVMCPPWEVDVTDDIRMGENEVEVTVYNTLNNHYQTIPTRYKVPTDNAPSGLIGPVVLNLVQD